MRKEQREMSDKELDDFFRKITEDPEIPYHPEDWDRMKAMLELHAAQGKVNGSKFWHNGLFMVLLGLMVLTGIGLGWKYLGKETQNDLASHPLPSAIEIKPEEKANNKPETMDAIEKVETKRAADPELGPSSADSPALPGKAAEQYETASDQVEGIDEGQAKASFSEIKSDMALRKVGGEPMTDQLHFKVQSFKDMYAMKPVSLEQLPFDSKPLDDIKVLHGPDPGEKQAPESKEGNGNDRGRFSIAFSLAPDVSALKIKDISGLGTSLGLNVEYFIHPNFSLNAGAMYAFKTYSGGGEDYKGYTPAPNRIDGDCWVLDLPLNMSYYVINQALGRWYVSSGISSYLMLREKYDLEYTYYSGKEYTKSMEVKNSNRHYFGIVNLSLGYERVLSDRLALQVEPYFKLPVANIGEGGLKLKSAGVLIGLKYNW